MIAYRSGNEHGISAKVFKDACGEGEEDGGARESSWNPGRWMFIASENDFTVTSRTSVASLESGLDALMRCEYSQ